MFCSSCGTESTGLNYCNRCGANLAGPIATGEPVPPINLTKPMLIIGAIVAFLTLGGFFMILESATVLMRTGAGKDVPGMIVVCGMFTVLTLDILLLLQMSKLITAALSSHKVPPAPALPSRFAAPMPQMAQPTPARLPVGTSVTENTTRFFESEPLPVEIRPNSEKMDR